MAVVTTGRGEGPRHYYDEDKPDIRYPSVTTVLDMIPADMSWWHGREAGKLAAKSAHDLSRMVENAGEKAVEDYIGGAAKRYMKYKGELGDRFHDYAERRLRGESPFAVADDLKPYVRQFERFLDTVQPEMERAEDIAWSDTHGYVGSFDTSLWVRINPETGRHDPQGERKLLMADWKTTNSLREKVAVQLAAYAHAETMIDGHTWERLLMPTYDGGVVFHVGPDFYDFRAVKLRSEVFDVFLSCLNFFQTMRRWDGHGRGRDRVQGIKNDVFGVSISKHSDIAVTGTQRRA